MLRRWSALVGVAAALPLRVAVGDLLSRDTEGEAYALPAVVVRGRACAGLLLGLAVPVLTREGRRVGSAYAGEEGCRVDWWEGEKIDIWVGVPDLFVVVGVLLGRR